MEDGDLTAGLAWTSDRDGVLGAGGGFSTTLSDGSHTITASVSDSDVKTDSASISITVGDPPAEPSTITVSSISYGTQGGKNGKKHLLIYVALLDELGNRANGASVSIDLFRDGALDARGTGTTATDGTVVFTRKNASSGAYSTTATKVLVSGLTWDGITPSNSYAK